MEGQGPSAKAEELYNTAIQVIGNARHAQFGSTDELINQLAWGDRAALMGDQQMAIALRATYILLEKVHHKLERLEQSMAWR
jgi:hypothetical protein